MAHAEGVVTVVRRPVVRVPRDRTALVTGIYSHATNGARYGTQECSAPRLNADDTDRTVLAAMREFYAHHTDLIAQAVTEA